MTTWKIPCSNATSSDVEDGYKMVSLRADSEKDILALPNTASSHLRDESEKRAPSRYLDLLSTPNFCLVLSEPLSKWVGVSLSILCWRNF